MNSRRDPYHTLETKLRSTIERGAAKPRSPFATTKQLPASCHCAPSACCSPAAAHRRRCSSPPLLHTDNFRLGTVELSGRDVYTPCSADFFTGTSTADTQLMHSASVAASTARMRTYKRMLEQPCCWLAVTSRQSQPRAHEARSATTENSTLGRPFVEPSERRALC